MGSDNCLPGRPSAGMSIATLGISMLANHLVDWKRSSITGADSLLHFDVDLGF